MITSKQNSFIKNVRALQDKKDRDESGLYIVTGVKMVKEAIISGQEILSVIFTEKGEKSLGNEFSSFDVERILVSDDVFKSLTYEVTPQGVLAVVKKPKVSLSCPKGKCLLLDGLQDPANVGAIIRTAVSMGYNELYLADCADAYSLKSVRASMSGIYKAKVYVGTRREILKYIDCPIIVADMDGKNVKEFIPPKVFCLAIGNEGNGISDDVKSLASEVIGIPMQNGMESLNASVSAGILMFNL